MEAIWQVQFDGGYKYNQKKTKNGVHWAWGLVKMHIFISTVSLYIPL